MTAAVAPALILRWPVAARCQPFLPLLRKLYLRT